MENETSIKIIKTLHSSSASNNDGKKVIKSTEILKLNWNKGISKLEKKFKKFKKYMNEYVQEPELNEVKQFCKFMIT